MKRHPFANYRAVRHALRRPLSQVLGTEAARLREVSERHVRGNRTRKLATIDLAKAMRVHVGLDG